MAVCGVARPEGSERVSLMAQRTSEAVS